MNQKCLFCGHTKFDVIAENECCYAIRDKYPVTALHTLIITKDHFDQAFELTPAEFVSIVELAKVCQQQIMEEDSSVEGFNFGTNIGAVAGQKINHVHFHLIPRRKGDVAPQPAMAKTRSV